MEELKRRRDIIADVLAGNSLYHKQLRSSFATFSFE